MIQYNVEFFDLNLNMVSHTNASGIEYAFDYVSPVRNEVTIFTCPVEKGNYIRIQGEGHEYFGIVKSVVSQTEKTITVEYGHFLEIFDTDIAFDTDLQGTSSLEQVIANIISDRFINSADTLQNITGLEVDTLSSTTGWGFNLKSDTEGKHTCIINLYNTIIVRALQEYGVAVDVSVDVQEKTIALTIGVIGGDEKVIEADLPNVIEKNVIIRETENDINKAVVYNTDDYTTTRTYYRHSDDTYDRINNDRITPVIQGTYGVAPEKDGDTVTKTFAQMADSKAAEVFGAIKYNNLIELKVMNNDSLVNPQGMKVGQVVRVISDSASYSSMFTGYTIGQTTSLVFGTIRIDLTKILRRRYANGG